MTTHSRIPPTKLALENPHPRDQFITFDEGPHIYTVHGDSSFTSVTTWNHQHFSHFDADAIIEKMKWKIENDPTNKYYKMTPEQIKAQWAQSGKEASGSGTDMHNDIERFYNDVPVDNTSIEYGYFMKFQKDFQHLKPYRTEWTIYQEDLKLSGSIDMVYENPDGTLQIYDWKRVKGFDYEGFNGKTSKTPTIKHIPDSNYWHYCLQLNTYKAILEAKYDKKVTALYLVRLHPDNYDGTYERVEVQDLQKEVLELFEIRRREIANQTPK